MSPGRVLTRVWGKMYPQWLWPFFFVLGKLTMKTPSEGAATTVLGVVPLLQDAFWISMAMTIMAGLTFGTVLTMVLVPTLYATLFRIRSPKPAAAG